ncbi:MAG TPA: hypothetical protein VMS17_26780 [Gemmataceae bacterium]|nr:hypothetical protein [Gemmataceae bacterium]
MDANEPDLVQRLHREAVQRHAEQKAQERALVEAMFGEARERQRQEEERGNALVDSLHRQAVESRQQLPPVESPTVHYSELPEAKPDSPLYREWETYRQELGRLLAEGNAGRHILIKDAQIIGIWETHDEAMAAGYRRFLGQAFLVHLIQERERVLRCVRVPRCRNSNSPSRPAN